MGIRWQNHQLTGYSQFEQTVATSGVQLFKNTQDLLFDVVEVQQLRAKTVASIPMYSENGPLNINGELYLGNQGKVQIFLDNAMNEPPRFSAGKLEIQGANKAMFDFSGEYIQLKADSTNDGNFDIGTYFISFDELLEQLLKTRCWCRYLSYLCHRLSINRISLILNLMTLRPRSRYKSVLITIRIQPLKI